MYGTSQSRAALITYLIIEAAGTGAPEAKYIDIYILIVTNSAYIFFSLALRGVLVVFT